MELHPSSRLASKCGHQLAAGFVFKPKSISFCYCNSSSNCSHRSAISITWPTEVDGAVGEPVLEDLIARRTFNSLLNTLGK